MTWETFARWMGENGRFMPRAAFLEIRAEGMSRLSGRLRAMEAGNALDFSDLIARGEDAISGRVL